MLIVYKLRFHLVWVLALFFFQNVLAIEATYHLLEDGNSALLAIDANTEFKPIVVVSDCASAKRTYSFKQYDKKTDKYAKHKQFLIYANNQHYYKSGPISEQDLLKMSDSLQIRKPQQSASSPPQFSINSERVNALINLCKSKYQTLIKNATIQAKNAAQKRQSLIDKVSSRHNLKPMFNGRNQMRMDDLVSDFLNFGYSNHIGKFIWLDDGTYKVDQVLDKGVIIKSRYSGLLPITIFTKEKALENQRWSAISRSPLKFIGVDSYDTVIGTKQQTLLFELL